MERVVTLMSAMSICAAMSTVHSATLIFPDISPIREASPKPAWLETGTGDDGYVSISARIKTPGPCTNLGSSGFLGIASEKIQLVITMRSSGFGSAFEGIDMPIATFDATADPSKCWGLATLPVTIISFARLQKFSPVSPGNLGLLVKVQSSANTEMNAVATAQTFISVAGLFTTGPAVATIASAAQTAAKPIFATLENGLNKSLSRAVVGQSSFNTSWSDFRSGISSLTIPVYKATIFRGKADARIAEFQASDASAKEKLFDIVLDVNYAKSIFDVSIVGKTDLPSGPSLMSARVLNQPIFTPNFLQLLNSSSPSLQQTLASASTPAAWTSACSKVNQQLENAGLARLDRLIVSKAFIDEARGGTDWYRAENLSSCFIGQDLDAFVIPMFGVGGARKPISEGAQLGVGNDYDSWIRRAVPLASDMAIALTLEKGGLATLLNLNARNDIDFRYINWTSVDAAPDPADTVGTAFFRQAPNIWRLGARRIKKAGCFAWFEQDSLAVSNMSVHMVAVDETGDLWRLQLQVDPSAGSPYKKVQVWKLTPEWRTSFESWVDSPSCKQVLAD